MFSAVRRGRESLGLALVALSVVEQRLDAVRAALEGAEVAEEVVGEQLGRILADNTTQHSSTLHASER